MLEEIQMHLPCLQLFSVRVGLRVSNQKIMLNLNSIIDTVKDGAFLLYIDITELPFKGDVF